MAYATKFTFDHVWRMFKETQMKIAAGDLTMLPEVRYYLMSGKLNRIKMEIISIALLL